MGEIKNDGGKPPRGIMWMGPVGAPPSDWVDPGNPGNGPDDGEPVEWTNAGYLTSDGVSYQQAKPAGDTFTIERTLHSTTITRTTADGAVTRIHSPHDEMAETMWEQILDQIQHVDPTSAEHIRSEYQRWQQTAADMPDIPFARYWYDSMVSDQPPPSAAYAVNHAFVETLGQHATDAYHRLQAAARVDWPDGVTSWEQAYADQPAIAAWQARTAPPYVQLDDVTAELDAEEESRIRRWRFFGGGD